MRACPQAGADIRRAVFMEEQGFQNEFDDADALARHLVLYQGGRPAGTCRLLPLDGTRTYLVGRIAVLPPFRGQGWAPLCSAPRSRTGRRMAERPLSFMRRFRPSPSMKSRATAPGERWSWWKAVPYLDGKAAGRCTPVNGLSYVAPLFLVILSNTAYHLLSKTTSAQLNPFAALTATYGMSFLGCIALFLLTPQGPLSGRAVPAEAGQLHHGAGHHRHRGGVPDDVPEGAGRSAGLCDDQHLCGHPAVPFGCPPVSRGGPRPTKLAGIILCAAGSPWSTWG